MADTKEMQPGSVREERARYRMVPITIDRYSVEVFSESLRGWARVSDAILSRKEALGWVSKMVEWAQSEACATIYFDENGEQLDDASPTPLEK